MFSFSLLLVTPTWSSPFSQTQTSLIHATASKPFIIAQWHSHVHISVNTILHSLQSVLYLPALAWALSRENHAPYPLPAAENTYRWQFGVPNFFPFPSSAADDLSWKTIFYTLHKFLHFWISNTNPLPS